MIANKKTVTITAVAAAEVGAIRMERQDACRVTAESLAKELKDYLKVPDHKKELFQKDFDKKMDRFRSTATGQIEQMIREMSGVSDEVVKKNLICNSELYKGHIHNSLWSNEQKIKNIPLFIEGMQKTLKEVLEKEKKDKQDMANFIKREKEELKKKQLKKKQELRRQVLNAQKEEKLKQVFNASLEEEEEYWQGMIEYYKTNLDRNDDVKGGDDDDEDDDDSDVLYEVPAEGAAVNPLRNLKRSHSFEAKKQEYIKKMKKWERRLNEILEQTDEAIADPTNKKWHSYFQFRGFFNDDAYVQEKFLNNKKSITGALATIKRNIKEVTKLTAIR